MIKACADLSALNLGRVIHSHVFVNGYASNSHVQSAIVTFYEKSSSLGIARKMFDKMSNRNLSCHRFWATMTVAGGEYVVGKVEVRWVFGGSCGGEYKACWSAPTSDEYDGDYGGCS